MTSFDMELAGKSLTLQKRTLYRHEYEILMILCIIWKKSARNDACHNAERCVWRERNETCKNVHHYISKMCGIHSRDIVTAEQVQSNNHHSYQRQYHLDIFLFTSRDIYFNMNMQISNEDELSRFMLRQIFIERKQ